MEELTKEVYFDIYCKECKYRNLKEEFDPCRECLTQPYNYDSHKPINFKEKRMIFRGYKV